MSQSLQPPLFHSIDPMGNFSRSVSPSELNTDLHSTTVNRDHAARVHRTTGESRCTIGRSIVPVS